MDIVAKSLVKASGTVVIGLVILFVSQLPPYVPSTALRTAAEKARSAQGSRAAMFELLDQCFPRGNLTPEDIGHRMSVLHSLENDAGFWATTRIECSASNCRVEASALIPVDARPDVCGGRTRHGKVGRRHDFADYFRAGE
jgi:hypothetical protein